jgi:archaellum component FlaC
LVPAEGSTDNKYDEYMTIDGKLEPVGSFTADLDDYVTVTTFNSTVGNLEEAIGKNTQDISTLNGLVATTKTNLETLTTEINNFKSVVGDLSAFTVENTLVEQVNHLTEQLKWQEIVIEE